MSRGLGDVYKRQAISADINLLIEVLTTPKPRTMPVPGPRYQTEPEYGMPIIQ